MKNKEIIAAIEGGQTSRKDIALIYESLFQEEPTGCDATFWKPINEAIIKRWSKSALIFIKELAWKIHERNKK